MPSRLMILMLISCVLSLTVIFRDEYKIKNGENKMGINKKYRVTENVYTVTLNIIDSDNSTMLMTDSEFINSKVPFEKNDEVEMVSVIFEDSADTDIEIMDREEIDVLTFKLSNGEILNWYPTYNISINQFISNLGFKEIQEENDVDK